MYLFRDDTFLFLNIISRYKELDELTDFKMKWNQLILRLIYVDKRGQNIIENDHLY